MEGNIEETELCLNFSQKSKGMVLHGEHKVFPWLQTFITRKLRGIKTFFFQNVTQLKKFFFYNKLAHFNLCSFCCTEDI